jgi:hypothetical protein
MIDLGDEFNMGCAKRIIHREMDTQLKDTTVKGCVLGTKDPSFPFENIIPCWPGTTVTGRVAL